jgi:DNA repair photolyase
MAARKGRGATGNLPGRFEQHITERVDDGWEQQPDDGSLRTSASPEHARSIISRNRSPDVPFEQSINPYRGCEHGCIYCFARPTHSYLNLSPGPGFRDAALLQGRMPRSCWKRRFAVPAIAATPIVLGTNTDPYQPLERTSSRSRDGCWRCCEDFRHPVSLITKGYHVDRDLDLLQELAQQGLASVCISLTSLNPELKRRLEPRATGPGRRLELIRLLRRAGVPVTVLIAPVIPVLTDPELERLIAAAAESGAESAGYVFAAPSTRGCSAVPGLAADPLSRAGGAGDGPGTGKSRRP